MNEPRCAHLNQASAKDPEALGPGDEGWLGVGLGLGRIVADVRHTHPLYTRITNIFGASRSQATMRPDPRWIRAR